MTAIPPISGTAGAPGLWRSLPTIFVPRRWRISQRVANNVVTKAAAAAASKYSHAVGPPASSILTLTFKLPPRASAANPLRPHQADGVRLGRDNVPGTFKLHVPDNGCDGRP